MKEEGAVLEKLTDKCTGCGLCAQLCPKHAITMEMGYHGFLYPVIDEDKCVHCGICRKNCPSMMQGTENTESEVFKQQYLIAYHKDDTIRRKSSSGAIYPTIAKYVISNGGVVYGAAFSESYEVEHQRAEDLPSAMRFCGSKYVQSGLQKIYTPLEDDLRSGRKVLFTGTPCQVEAIKVFCIQKHIPMNKLYTIDLICHGVPSPECWKEHLGHIAKKRNKEVKEITFRYKDSIGNGQALRVCFYNRKDYFARSGQDSFYNLFLKDVILRDSCYQCKYASLYRYADITIGDLWNKAAIPADISDDAKGISEILINTSKGAKVFAEISAELDMREVKQEDIMQGALKKSPNKPSGREHFWELYEAHGYERAVWKSSNWKWKLKLIAGQMGIQDFIYRVKHIIKG